MGWANEVNLGKKKIIDKPNQQLSQEWDCQWLTDRQAVPFPDKLMLLKHPFPMIMKTRGIGGFPKQLNITWCTQEQQVDTEWFGYLSVSERTPKTLGWLWICWNQISNSLISVSIKTEKQDLQPSPPMPTFEKCLFFNYKHTACQSQYLSSLEKSTE